MQTVAVTDIENGVLVAESTLKEFGITPTFIHVGYDLKTGQEIWRQNWTDIEWGSGGTSAPGLIGYWGKGSGEGYYMFFEKETMQWHVIDITTGIEHFVTDPINEYTGTDWSVYDWTVHAVYGKLFVSGYSGCVVAFDLESGDHLWTFDQGPSGMQTPFGRWPLFGSLGFADNKVFFPVTEHTPTTPIHRGFRVYALDVDSGNPVWEFPAFLSSLAFADGYMVGYSGYDNQIYCFGKGPTQTTATVQSDIVSLGSAAMVKGTVMDISSGTEQDVVAKRFPNGLPVISEEDMIDWMKNVYLQNTTVDASGVTVKLEMITPNGVYENLDTTISDIYGNWAYAFCPEELGTYMFIATFEGSDAYYGSAQTTYLTVVEPTETEPDLSGIEGSVNSVQDSVANQTTYLLVILVLVIIAILLAVYSVIQSRK